MNENWQQHPWAPSVVLSHRWIELPEGGDPGRIEQKAVCRACGEQFYWVCFSGPERASDRVNKFALQHRH